MKNIEFIKRNNSKELISEFPNSTFVTSQYDFTDAIIGVTSDGKIVYDHFYMESIIYRSHDMDGYDYMEDFDDEDHYADHVHEKVCILQNQFQSTYYYENPPLFCTDSEFLENTYPSLIEFEIGVFEDEMYDDEEE